MSRYRSPFEALPVPFALRTGTITEESIELGWSVAGSYYRIDGYLIDYRDIYGYDYPQQAFSEVPFVTLNNLLSGTQYVIQVRSLSQGEPSDFSQEFFATTRGPFLGFNKSRAPQWGLPYKTPALGCYPPSRAW